MDYAPLQALLGAGQWREAEDETRARLIEAAGPGAVKRNWVYFSEVAAIPVEDMRTLDTLWRAASNGKFGYSVQVRRGRRGRQGVAGGRCSGGH